MDLLFHILPCLMYLSTLRLIQSHYFFLFSFMKGDNPARITDNRGDALTLPASEHSFQYPNDPNNYYNQQFQHYGQSRQLEGIMKPC